MLLVVTEGGLAVVAHDWGMDDVVLHTAGRPSSRPGSGWRSGGSTAQREADDPEAHVIRSGEVVVDDATYTAKLGGRSLDLTFKEFELLKFLAQHPGRVFSRQQLLQEVWGYDYFGGTRTVDVHVRRLRAKLGPEHETLIGTVRNVGYRFVIPTARRPPPATARTPEGACRDGYPVDRVSRSSVRCKPRQERRRRLALESRPWTTPTLRRDRGDHPRRSAAADGAEPLDEGAWRRLRHHADELDVRVEPERRVHGRRRRPAAPRRRPALAAHGLGARLLDDALGDRPGPWLAWSHGDHPAAAALARRTGFDRVRELWVMRTVAGRPGSHVPAARGAARTTSARSGRGDEAELLRVNAAAFAHHPEQGAMDAAELAERMAEPWFDPAGLLVADAGRPAARVPLDQAALRDARRGVRRRRSTPPSQGLGLGQGPRRRRPATPPRAAALDEVLLYVESDNVPAVGLYEGLGLHPRRRPTRT